MYVALCYYKLDYYDVSLEVLGIYLQKYPDSVIATNLKACNYFRMYSGKSAETEIKALLVSDDRVQYDFKISNRHLDRLV